MLGSCQNTCKLNKVHICFLVKLILWLNKHSLGYHGNHFEISRNFQNLKIGISGILLHPESKNSQNISFGTYIEELYLFKVSRSRSSTGWRSATNHLKCIKSIKLKNTFQSESAYNADPYWSHSINIPILYWNSSWKPLSNESQHAISAIDGFDG